LFARFKKFYWAAVMTAVRALIASIAFAAMPALGQMSPQHNLEADGGRVLERHEVEKLVFGSRISTTDAQGRTRAWTHAPRGTLVATLQQPGSSRPLNGQGTANVDEHGAYCVRIEWPRTVESWCRQIVAANGAYYAVSDDPGQPRMTALQIMQPDRSRLSTLSRLWSLARVAPGATGR
jgi:hypothetical protein